MAPRNQEVLNQEARTSPTGDVLAAPVPSTPPALVKVNGRNLAYDALAEVTGIRPGSPRAASIPAALNGTHSKPGIRQLAWAEILSFPWPTPQGEYLEAAIADLIRSRAVAYRRRFTDAELTPTALLRWWVDLPHLPERGDPGALDVARIANDELNRMREDPT